ncbi:MAG: VTT domain-containing protein [Candidatus Methylomirabilia bacterium]
MKVTWKRLAVVLLTYLIAIAIISSTLGREILAGKEPGLGSFSIIHFAGYLFFLVLPVEALVPYYQAEGHAGVVLIIIAVVTAISAQVIDYGIGYAVSQRISKDVIGQERYNRANRAVRRYGRWAILFFNLLPLSSPNVLLIAGIMRFGLTRAVSYSLLGLILKYMAIVYAFRAVT